MHKSREVLGVLTQLFVFVAAGWVTFAIIFPGVGRWAVGIHQKSVTRSLAIWGIEDARITNEASAIHAAGMVGYMSSYYVPGPGYRGPREIEAALERQRRESIERMIASLERFTGLDYGTNVERWTEWADVRRRSHGPANENSPVRR